MSAGALGSRRNGYAVKLGLALVFLLFGLGFAWVRQDRFPGPEARVLGTQRLSLTAAGAGISEIPVRIAGDAWPGYAPFRGEPVLANAFRAAGYRLQYAARDAFDEPLARLQALRSGQLDVALVPLASLVQFAVQSSEPSPALVVQFVIDVSNGGDALLSAPSLGAAQLPDTTACGSMDGASDALGRFAQRALPDAFAAKPLATVSSQATCFDLLRDGKSQLAALRNPYAALARSAGHRVLLSSREVKGLNFDVAVSRAELNPLQRAAIQALASAYFASVARWRAEPEVAARFLQQDCGELCAKDGTLGSQLWADLKPVDLEGNGCAWFGVCAEGGSLLQAVSELSALYAKAGRCETDSALTAAVPCLALDKQPAGTLLQQPETLFDTSTLLELAKQADLNFAAPLGGEPQGVPPASSVASAHLPFASLPGSLHYEVFRLSKPGVATAFVGKLSLPKLEFAPGSFQIEPPAQELMKDWIELLWHFSGLCLQVTGYSTAKEEPEPDFRLSRVRAQAVAQELTRLSPSMFPETRFDIVAQRSEAGVVNARSVEIGVLRCKVW